MNYTVSNNTQVPISLGWHYEVTDIQAGAGTVITHNLNLANPEQIIIQVLDSNGGLQSLSQYKDFTANSVTLVASGFARTGCRVTMFG